MTTVTPVRTGPRPTTSAPSPSMMVAWPTRTPRTSVIASCAPGARLPMRMPSSRAGTFPPIRSVAGLLTPPYHRLVFNSSEARSAQRHGAGQAGTPSICLRVPALDRVAPLDAAEAFGDLPGLALLESARPGRTGRWSYLTADPIAVVDAASDGPDPFAEARSILARMGGDPVGGPMGGGEAGPARSRRPCPRSVVASSASSAMTWATVRAAAVDRPGRPAPANAPARPPGLDPGLGPPDGPRVAGGTGGRWRRQPARSAPR